MVDIDRINFLAKKQREEGLTEEEKAEQAKLRRAYIDSVVGNLKSQLDNTYVVEGDEKKKVDIGYVGAVQKVNVALIEDLLDQDYVPIIAPIGVGANGESYNINADYVAAEIAGALHAEKLLLLTDVEGIYKDFSDKSSFLSTLHMQEARDYIKSGVIQGGMIPKVEACLTSLEKGTGKTHIIDGRLDHSIILEIFTSQGIGTQVVR